MTFWTSIHSTHCWLQFSKRLFSTALRFNYFYFSTNICHCNYNEFLKPVHCGLKGSYDGSLYFASNKETVSWRITPSCCTLVLASLLTSLQLYQSESLTLMLQIVTPPYLLLIPIYNVALFWRNSALKEMITPTASALQIVSLRYGCIL